MCAEAVNWLKGKVQPALELIQVSETSPALLFLHLEKILKFRHVQSLRDSSFLSGFILFHVSCVETEVAINLYLRGFLELMTLCFKA